MLPSTPAAASVAPFSAGKLKDGVPRDRVGRKKGADRCPILKLTERLFNEWFQPGLTSVRLLKIFRSSPPKACSTPL